MLYTMVVERDNHQQQVRKLDTILHTNTNLHLYLHLYVHSRWTHLAKNTQDDYVHFGVLHDFPFPQNPHLWLNICSCMCVVHIPHRLMSSSQAKVTFHWWFERVPAPKTANGKPPHRTAKNHLRLRFSKIWETTPPHNLPVFRSPANSESHFSWVTFGHIGVLFG